MADELSSAVAEGVIEDEPAAALSVSSRTVESRRRFSARWSTASSRTRLRVSRAWVTTALLQQNESRVASLADAVTALNVHIGPPAMRVKEVAALAEERVAALEERLGAAYGAELAGAQQRSNNAVESLTVRLQALEAAVQQEQQSSLKALQAILHSAHAR